MRTFLSFLRQMFGCRKNKWRIHIYEWGFGPDAELTEMGAGLYNVIDLGGGWWLYCVYCGKGIWRNG